MMRRRNATKLTWTAVLFSLLITAPAHTRTQIDFERDRQVVRRPIPEAARGRAVAFARTELFFGTVRPGGVVTDAEFRGFLDDEVTPRFPEGLTLLTAAGQFKGADGLLVKEASFVLVLMYPADTAIDSHWKIETIRHLYMSRFQQESVLRADSPLGVWVSF